MKKLFYMMLVAVLAVPLCACGSEETSQNAQASSGSSGQSTQASGEADVDLTKLSSTMVYSEVYNMTYDPGSYLGKTVKMNGTFTSYENPETNERYFACIIADAAACCSQGIEFSLSDSYAYPDDYPDPESQITVMGTFTAYTENGMQYYKLSDAALVG